jgi:hypothetical protein
MSAAPGGPLPTKRKAHKCNGETRDTSIHGERDRGGDCCRGIGGLLKQQQQPQQEFFFGPVANGAVRAAFGAIRPTRTRFSTNRAACTAFGATPSYASVLQDPDRQDL